MYKENPDDEPDVDLDLLKAEDDPGDSLAVGLNCHLSF
jgi:hypothetical protein